MVDLVQSEELASVEKGSEATRWSCTSCVCHASTQIWHMCGIEVQSRYQRRCTLHTPWNGRNNSNLNSEWLARWTPRVREPYVGFGCSSVYLRLGTAAAKAGAGPVKRCQPCSGDQLLHLKAGAEDALPLALIGADGALLNWQGSKFKLY